MCAYIYVCLCVCLCDQNGNELKFSAAWNDINSVEFSLFIHTKAIISKFPYIVLTARSKMVFGARITTIMPKHWQANILARTPILAQEGQRQRERETKTKMAFCMHEA